MTALSKDRKVIRRDGKELQIAAKSGVTIHQGALLMLDGSEVIPAKTATGKTVVGFATAPAKGGEKVNIERGVIDFDNSTSSDAITVAEIGKDCYVVDDQTVAKTDGSKTRSVAGKVSDVSDGRVWVKIG